MNKKLIVTIDNWRFPGGDCGKESACKAGGPGSIPGSGRSPREGNCYPLQHSCLENPMDRGVWRATVHRVAKIGYDWNDLVCIHNYCDISFGIYVIFHFYLHLITKWLISSRIYTLRHSIKLTELKNPRTKSPLCLHFCEAEFFRGLESGLVILLNDI